MPGGEKRVVSQNATSLSPWSEFEDSAKARTRTLFPGEEDPALRHQGRVKAPGNDSGDLGAGEALRSTLAPSCRPLRRVPVNRAFTATKCSHHTIVQGSPKVCGRTRRQLPNTSYDPLVGRASLMAAPMPSVQTGALHKVPLQPTPSTSAAVSPSKLIPTEQCDVLSLLQPSPPPVFKLSPSATVGSPNCFGVTSQKVSLISRKPQARRASPPHIRCIACLAHHRAPLAVLAVNLHV